MSDPRSQSAVGVKVLRFSYENAKLRGQGIYTFSLPSGHTCPGALRCWAKADRETGKVTDHPQQLFRCFEVTTESAFSTVRRMRWVNRDILVGTDGNTGLMAMLLSDALPKEAKIVRIHVGGDFFSQAYFDAWLTVCEMHPAVRFYGYTKSLHFWAQRLTNIPANLMLIASYGGRYDHLIGELHLRSAVVVAHPDEAAELGLEVDHDDRHAHSGTESFGLLIHGTQAPGSIAAQAIKRMKDEGVAYSYSHKKKP